MNGDSRFKFPNQGSRGGAEHAERAGLLRASASPREPLPESRRNRSVVFPGKIAHFLNAVIQRSQSPNQSLQRNAHRRGLRRHEEFDFMFEVIINRQPSGRG